MRESRVVPITNPTAISTATTTNGPTLDLKSVLGQYVGDYFEGAPSGYGVGVELLFTAITGTANNVEVYWQTSDDGATWEGQELIMKGELSALKTAGGTKVAVSSRLRTPRRYARIVFVTTVMTASSFSVSGWFSDATNDFEYGESKVRI